MPAALVGTALVMGLAGGPHCAAMCGAACAGFTHAGDSPARRGRVFGAGLLWTFMPCGLLYSALLVASLAGGVLQGAAAMAAFAAGSAVSLWAAPFLLAWLRGRGDRWRRDWGTRAAGAVLAG